jgi:hypothetical protein
MSATASIVWRSAGTGTTSPPTTTVPLSVPKAMVLTGTERSAASRAASSTGRPTVVAPSDRRTMLAGRS